MDDVVRGCAEETASETDLRDELEHALRLLDPLERTLLLGFHRDGMTLKELASTHGLPLNTIKSHLHRARRKLPGGRS
jgi:RNA polymerase sigma-70 factor (ECF subfamily)